MKVTAHNYSNGPRGLEYSGFRADMFIDGKLAARVWNDGNGGPNAYQWMGDYANHRGFTPPKAVQDWLDSLPPVSYHGHSIQLDLDCVFEDAIDAYRAARAN